MRVTPSAANAAIVLARKHAGNDSSRLCLADAVALFDVEQFTCARMRALHSLAYSVGILHADYERAAKRR